MEKWYLCKRDIGVTILVAILAFFIDPQLNKMNMTGITDILCKVNPYLVFLTAFGYLNMMLFMLIESLFIHLEHYWQWNMVALFSTTCAGFLGSDMRSIGSISLYEIAWMTTVNGIFFFLPVALVAVLVYFIRKKSRGDNDCGR